MRLVSAKEYTLLEQLSRETLKLRRELAEKSIELDQVRSQLREVEMTLGRQSG